MSARSPALGADTHLSASRSDSNMRVSNAVFPNLLMIASLATLPRPRGDHDALDAGLHRHGQPAIAQPQLVEICDPLEPPVVADQRGGFASSDQLDDLSTALPKVRAVREALEFRVNALVQAIPAYPEPGLVDVDITR